jgi:hypothetical protein
MENHFKISSLKRKYKVKMFYAGNKSLTNIIQQQEQIEAVMTQVKSPSMSCALKNQYICR